MTENYDVIIIGSGAGGGTLAHTLAESGKRILLLERGDFLPREMDNWDPKPVFVDGRYISKDTWYDRDGKPFQPQVHYFVGGATKLYGAALYRLRPEDFGEIKHVRRDLPGLAAVLRRLRALVHQGRAAVPGARQRRRGPDRGPPQRALPLARGLARAPDPGDLRRPGQGRLPPVPRAVRDHAERGRPATQHLHPLRLVRRLPVPGARQGRRRGHRGPAAARPAQRHPAHRRRGDQAGDRQLRPHGHRSRGVPGRRARGLPGRHRGRLRRGGQQRQDPAQLGQRRPPERPGERVRSGGTQLHVPQLQGDRGPVQGAERHRLPEDAGHQRLLLRRPRTTSGPWATSR